MRANDGGCRLVNSRGLTLIEMIVFIIVAGIFIPLAYIGFTSAIKGVAEPRNIIKARFLAEQKMEDLTRVPFDSIAIESPAYATVDGYPGYEWKWSVAYVGCTVSGTYPNFTITINESSSACGGSTGMYKRIEVSVRVKGDEYKVHTIVTKRAA